MVIIFLAPNLAAFSVVKDVCIPHPWFSMGPCAAKLGRHGECLPPPLLHKPSPNQPNVPMASKAAHLCQV